MIKIYGHSDDVVCIDGDSFSDEVSLGRMITIGDEKRGMNVVFKYAAGKKSGAVWRGCVEQIEENIPMFPISVSEAEPSGGPDPCTYSVLFTIDCPIETPVFVGKRNLNKGASK